MTDAHGWFPQRWIKAAIMRSAYDKTITKRGGKEKSILVTIDMIRTAFWRMLSLGEAGDSLVAQGRFRYNENNSQLLVECLAIPQ
jgi:hypothetical protein